MKTNKFKYLLVLTILFMSCEDYLDKVQDVEGLNEEDIFTDIRLATNFLDGAYRNLISEVGSRVSQQSDLLPAMVMSDEGHPGNMTGNVVAVKSLYAEGDYLSLMDGAPDDNNTPFFVARYNDGWKGIRTVNTFFENIDLIFDATEEEVNLLKGQAYFLRAYFYHLMTKRHGGLPYFKETLDLAGNLDRTRDSYESNYANMIEDLDLAIDLLPTSWPSENVGRPTKGAAMALKSRITLFAASPLANSTSWEVAATAAADLINFANANGLYSLIDASNAINIDVAQNGADLLVPEPDKLQSYRNIFIGPGTSKVIPSEVILMEANEFFDWNNGNGGRINPIPRLSLVADWNIIRANQGPKGIGAMTNIVSRFETKNGLAIEDDPSFNPQNPFINRDPRFYNNILFDGVRWTYIPNGALNTTGFVDLATVNEDGRLGLDFNQPGQALWRVRNTTGYKIRKWLPNGAFWRNGNNGNHNFYVNNIMFRMAEVYLNYAEAVNEAFGPNGSVTGVGLTAIDAVNLIRNRVGMPDVNGLYTGSKETFRERIRNERAIELSFEGFRYDDIRRWKVAHLPEYKEVGFLEMRWQGGVSETFPTGFSFNNVPQVELEKTFDEKHYWWPVPTSDISASPSYLQTEGW